MSTFMTIIRTWKWYLVGGALILIFAAATVFSLFDGSEAAPQSSSKRSVDVSTVAASMQGGNSLSMVADIQSKSEAKISPESSGRIVRVNATLGQRVGAGQILAEIENASQRAALLQAEGVLDAAKASVSGTESTTVATILSAYAAVDNAISDAVNQINTDPSESNPTFSVSTRDTVALAEMERLRPSMPPILKRHTSQSALLNDASNLADELALLESELRAVRNYLDVVLRVLNAGVAREDVTLATISGYVADVSAARTGVTSALTAVVSARTSLDSQSGVSTSQASVKQAQGAYNAALANLEKTIIRSPISGTLNHFTVKLGDTVTAQQQVAIVSNNAALEAVVYVAEEDKDRLRVGQTATFEGGVEGTITKIAPALDPVTRKIEVRIGLPSGAPFTNGQSVRVELTKRTETQTSGPLAVPITALRIEADRAVVYSVVDGVIQAKEVQIGKLSGSSAQITSGLTLEDEIVLDARGLKEGEAVETR